MKTKIRKYFRGIQIIKRLKYKRSHTTNSFSIYDEKEKKLENSEITIEDCFEKCLTGGFEMRLPKIYSGGRDGWNILKKYKINKNEIEFSFNDKERLIIKGNLKHEIIFNEHCNMITLTIENFSILEYIELGCDNMKSKKAKTNWTFTEGKLDMYIHW